MVAAVFSLVVLSVTVQKAGLGNIVSNVSTLPIMCRITLILQFEILMLMKVGVEITQIEIMQYPE